MIRLPSLIEGRKKFRPDPDLKLMDQVRQVMRYHHHRYRTEQTYCDWIIRYMKYHKCQKHPREMGKTETESFLSHLASERKVSASAQRQALNAIVFLYTRVLDMPVAENIGHVRAKQHRRPPVVMTKNEVRQVLARMGGSRLLMAKMLYGCGLRLMECIRLRIRDLDFGNSGDTLLNAVFFPKQPRLISFLCQRCQLSNSCFERNIPADTQGTCDQLAISEIPVRAASAEDSIEPAPETRPHPVSGHVVEVPLLCG